MEKTFEFPIEDLILVQPENEQEPKPEDGEGEGGEGEPEDQDGGGGEGEPEDQDGGGGEGEPEDQDGGGQQMDDEITDDEVDRIQDEIEDALSDRGDNTEEDLAKEQQARAGAKQGADNAEGKRSKFTQAKEIAPKFSWKELMQQFIMTQSSTDTTYQKMSRRGISGIAAAAQTGAGAIVPGEKVEDQGFKLLFVFDTSASMHHAVNVGLSEAQSLIKNNFDKVEGKVTVVFFADSPVYFIADLLTNRSWPVRDFTDIDRQPAAVNPLDAVFKIRASGGTNFSPRMVSEISRVIGQGYNVIMFTDEGIADDDNWKNFLKLYTGHRSNIFLIVDSRYTFDLIAKKLGNVVPSTFGVLE